MLNVGGPRRVWDNTMTIAHCVSAPWACVSRGSVFDYHCYDCLFSEPGRTSKTPVSSRSVPKASHASLGLITIYFSVGRCHRNMCSQNTWFYNKIASDYYFYFFYSWRGSSFSSRMHDYDYFYFLFRCLHEAKVTGRTHHKLFLFLSLLAPGGQLDYPANSYR